jgi:2'-5' RNA ligase
VNALVDAFERAAIDAGSFHHRDHIHVAWSYLSEFELGEAAQRFTAALRRFAVANGAPNLYHATITWAYLVAIHDRMHREGAAAEWDSFAAANADLFAWKPSFLDALYLPETLASDHAKRVFVLPDRVVTECPTTPASVY